MTDAVAVAAPDHVGNDLIRNVEESLDLLQTRGLSLHGKLVAEKTAYARVLIDTIRPQQDKKNTKRE